MDSGASSVSGIGRLKKVEKTRRSWSPREEEILTHALKELIDKGWKSENGFKAGYLNLLETTMQTAIPSCTLRGNPHINSKIYVCKKTYGSLMTILSRSGVGWNETNHTIDVNDETWEAIVMADQTLRTMRYKQWTHYDDWCEIFGNDRATGEQTKTFQHALHEVLHLDDQVPNDIPIDVNPTFSMQKTFEDSVSETNATSSKPKACATSKSKKRKLSVDADESIVAAINNLAHITKDTMGELIKELPGVDKIAAVQDKVLEALAGIKELTDDEQVMVAKLLFNNHNDLALFERLGDKGRLTLVRRLLNGQ